MQKKNKLKAAFSETIPLTLGCIGALALPIFAAFTIFGYMGYCDGTIDDYGDIVIAPATLGCGFGNWLRTPLRYNTRFPKRITHTPLMSDKPAIDCRAFEKYDHVKITRGDFSGCTGMLIDILQYAGYVVDYNGCAMYNEKPFAQYVRCSALQKLEKK